MVLLKQERVIHMLVFDKQGLAKELLKNLKIELETAGTAWEFEVMSKQGHNYFGEGTNPQVDHKIKTEVNGIVLYLQANTYVLADSYGTGSFMLDNNPGFAEYKSKNWHADRHSKAIHGRKAGTYYDVFGRKHETSGAFKGVNIEGKKVYTRKKENEKDYFISPTRPSYAVQLAEKWLYTTYLPRAYKLAVQRTNFAKFLIES